MTSWIKALQNEISWSIVRRETGSVYTRPLLGTELVSDQYAIFQEGTAEACQGLTIKCTLGLSEVESRLRDAIARLRFYSPLVAASLERGLHDPQFRSWVYKPVSSFSELQSWIQETVVVKSDPMENDDFLIMINETRLPYISPDGTMHIFRCFLVPTPGEERTFTIYFHGSHAILDARPTLNIFSLVLDWMTNPPTEALFTLKWGTEWSNLPVGPVTATGGLRPGFETEGLAAMNKIIQTYMNPVPTLGLSAQRSKIEIPGRPVRVRTTLDKDLTDRILKAVKQSGYSVTHLFEAAQCLAILSRNSVPDESMSSAHVTFPMTIISLDRYQVPPHNTKGKLVSLMAHLPLTIPYIGISNAEQPRAQLLGIMQIVKAQYDEYMRNPHLPHLTAAMVQLAPPRKPVIASNPYATVVTNVGVVEHIIPMDWYVEGDSSMPPLLQILSMWVSHRLISTTPMTHIWSLRSKLVVQVETNDVFDESYIRAYLDDVVQYASAICA